jgi:dTDP-4-dehydrorhamnose 3,5-epimerase-like enzyme
MQAALVEVPLMVDPLGSIGVVEGPQLLPFDVKRFYFIHGVPPNATRGSHAHRQLHQLIIAVSGSVTVTLDDGASAQQFFLGGPQMGLHVPPGFWRTLEDFAPNTVVAVLASREYDESDYIRNYQDFVAWRRDA